MLSGSTLPRIMACRVFRAQSRNDLGVDLATPLQEAEDRKLYNAFRKALRRSRWVNVLIRYFRIFKIPSVDLSRAEKIHKNLKKSIFCWRGVMLWLKKWGRC